MSRKIVVLLALVMSLCLGVAWAITFTDVDVAQHHGKTGLKSLVSDLDANFAQIESGKFVQSTDTNNVNVKVQSGIVTMHAGTAYTQTFETVFTATPIVTATYTEDPGDVRPIYVTAVSNQVIFTVTADKDFNWQAIGR